MTQLKVGQPPSSAKEGLVRDGLSSADSATLATFKTAHDADEAGGAIDVSDRQLVFLKAIFSAASQTCGVRVYLFHADPETGAEDAAREPYITEEITLTGTDRLDSNSEYLSELEKIEADDFSLVRVALTTAPASGTVDLYLGSRG